MHDDEIMRYRKKAQKNTPKKSNHKHEYVNCVYGFNGQKFSRERGFEPVPELCMGLIVPSAERSARHMMRARDDGSSGAGEDLCLPVINGPTRPSGNLTRAQGRSRIFG